MTVALPAFRDDALAPDALDRALRAWGGFFVELSGAAAGLPAGMLAASHAFFSLPDGDKRALAIERSAHFRGWSQMHNERDWREQLHLGRERPAADERPEFRRLEGPNLWPEDAAWRGVVAGYIDAAARIGGAILDALARALGVGAGCFARVGSDGYLVAKLIGYHPQQEARAARSGVAAHVDFSWLTINLQDSAGLEVRRPDGAWTPVDVRPGAVWVHAGELLEHATRGRYAAAPHRVVNPSARRTRVSVPVFVNPPLDAIVPVFDGPDAPAPAAGACEHVHRVIAPRARRAPFHFGRAEWRRKGEGGWCFSCCPGTLEDARA
jgi:isopenicillin N synthase-like dioxygenase